MKSYTREVAEEVIKDLNGYNNGFGVLSLSNVAFLDSKFTKKLPETGLLVSENGSLAFKTGEESGYGFDYDDFFRDGTWSFIGFPEHWKPSTPKDVERFKTLVLKELKSRGIEEGTEFKSLFNTNGSVHLKGNQMELCENYISIGGCLVHFNGKWVEPIKKDVLKDVVTALESTLKEGYIIESKDGVVTIKSI